MASTAELAVKVNAIHAQRMRKSLEDLGLWDGTRRLQRPCSSHVLIPVTGDVRGKLPTINGGGHYYCTGTTKQEGPCSSCDDYLDRTANHGNRPMATGVTSSDCITPVKLGGIDGMIVQAALPPSKKTRLKTPYEKLRSNLERFVTDRGLPWRHELERDVPIHWESHGDLLLLPESSFMSPVWTVGPEMEGLWALVAESLGCKRLARKSRVQSDDYRTPAVELLLGEGTWVQHIDNGIRYCYDIQHCMFSAGNITEKIRVGAFSCQGETVVDLFAGIGYFTLPYLVHAGAKIVHACEWNPHAVKALERNLELNGVKDRCQVHYGDNRKVCPRSVADRVNLGLIPSSEISWPVACQALRPTGGMMHVHGNVESSREPAKGRLSDSNRRAPESSTENLSVDGEDHCQKCAGGDPLTAWETEKEKHSSVDGGKSPQRGTESDLATCGQGLAGCSRGLKGQSRMHVHSRINSHHVPLRICAVCSKRMSQGYSEATDISGLEHETCPLRDAGGVSSLCDPSLMGCPCELQGQSSMHRNMDTSTEPLRDGVLSPDRGMIPQGSAKEDCVFIPSTGQEKYPKKCPEDDLISCDGGCVICTNTSKDQCNIGDISHVPLNRDAHCSQCGNQVTFQEIRRHSFNGCTLRSQKVGNSCESDSSNKVSGVDINSSKQSRAEWLTWARYVAREMRRLLEDAHEGTWDVRVCHIEHVKSYAPRVDHLVADVKCAPRWESVHA